jgi:hypothetical protein
MSVHLTNAASDLEAYLKRSIRFYLTVGWLKEDASSVLMVYYDEHYDIPDKLLPRQWRGYEVRSQPTYPLGARRPVQPGPQWII